MAHISFLTYGTRGDVEPFLALAHEFRDRGFDIRFAAPSDFEDWVTSEGFDYRPTTRSPISKLVADPILEDLMHFNILKLRKALKSLEGFMHETIVETMPKAIGSTDLIIAHCGLPIATDIAEHVNAPLVYVSPVPAAPTRHFPIVPFTGSLGFLNKATYWPLIWARAFTPKLYRDARSKMGLCSASRFQKAFFYKGKAVPIVHAFSPHLIPRPDDWPDHAYITGNFFYDRAAQGWAPSPTLDAFLNDGPPPVYIGFGSMNIGKAKNLVEIVLSAARALNQRVLLSKGWAELALDQQEKTTFMIGDAPHHALFPKVRAVVHHGGAGTTAAGLRAGKASLICPFGFDQPWWGALIARRGLGPAPIAQKKLTTARFTAALDDVVHNPIYHEKARALGMQMADERGVKTAAQLIIDLFKLDRVVS